ncbi:MAG: SEC-C domain-containing protein [Firmicutes bacterium]|nr:SEC-C domain-containing protein [Bacillota bacterium]
MSIYENWLKRAFTPQGKSVDAVWNEYLPKEQAIYEYILEEKVTEIKGSVDELAERFNITAEYAIAFVDGLNDILPNPYKIDELDEKSQIEIIIDFEKLYKKMVEYHAEHLYNLKQWDNIFTEDQRKEFYIEQKRSRTVIKEPKVGRNDPCPCGSGKKYKKCCGA